MTVRRITAIALLSTTLFGSDLRAEGDDQALASAAIRVLLGSRLVDPGSLVLAAMRRTRSGRWCGPFNAKNRFGRFAGRRRFMADIEASTIFIEPDLQLQPRSKQEAAQNLESFKKIQSTCVYE